MSSASRDPNFSAYVQLWEFNAVEKKKGWFTKHWWVCRSNQHKKRWKPLSDIVVVCHTQNCCEQGLAEAQDERLVFQASCRRAGTFYLKGFPANLLSNAGDTDLARASRNGLMRFLSLLNRMYSLLTTKQFQCVWWVLVVFWQDYSVWFLAFWGCWRYIFIVVFIWPLPMYPLLCPEYSITKF